MKKKIEKTNNKAQKRKDLLLDLEKVTTIAKMKEIIYKLIRGV